MPTDWLNAPTAMKRTLVYPTLRRRVCVFVLFVVALALSCLAWQYFKLFFVSWMLQGVMWPFVMARWLLSFLPPFVDSASGDGTQVSASMQAADQGWKVLSDAANQTLGKARSIVILEWIHFSFCALVATSVYTWIKKQFRLANASVSPLRPAPFVFWREGLGLAINYVAFFTFFGMVYQRVSSKPTGDSSGGIDSVLFVISETVEALALFVTDTVIRTSRLELRSMHASISFAVNQAVDDAWEHLPLGRTYPVTLYAQQAKSLMWISVCCTVLDLLLLFTGGGGMMQRLNDHLLGSTLIMARMEGAGDNDSWQFATTMDLNIRLGIVLCLEAQKWHHTATLMTFLLSIPYLTYAIKKVHRWALSLTPDSSGDSVRDQGLRSKWSAEQERMQELAANAQIRSQNATPSQGLSLADRAKKYAPAVYKELAGHDWDNAGEGNAASGEGGVRRRRKGGCVEVLETFKEWETLRSDAEIFGKRLLVVYTGPDGGGKVVEDLERIAAEYKGAFYAVMDASRHLDRLSRSDVSFAGRFPVIHVYDGTRKLDQAMSLDIAEIERMVKVTNKAINAPAKKASMGATPNPWGASGGGNDTLGGGGGEVIEIGTKLQYDQVLASAGDSLVVIDFTATWCGPCQRIKPRYHDMASEFPQCFFCQVDVDSNDETAAFCRVSRMPTFQFYKGGRKVHTIEGADEHAIREAVMQYA